MALPKIITATYDVTVPFINLKVKVRQMLVKEEKILLMAKQSEEKTEQINAIKQVVQNCLVTDKIDVDNIPFFATEYLFLKIRSFSVSNKAKAAFRDNEDSKIYNFDVELDKVELRRVEEQSNAVDLGGGISVLLKYPPTSLFTTKGVNNLADEKAFETILSKCIEKIFHNEEIYFPDDVTEEEMTEFINSIPSKSYEKIQAFFNSIPTLFYEIKYTNSMGTERTITMETLEDFFTF